VRWLENACNGKGPRQRHVHPPTPHKQKEASYKELGHQTPFISGIFWVDATRTFHYACRSIDHFCVLVLVFALATVASYATKYVHRLHANRIDSDYLDCLQQLAR